MKYSLWSSAQLIRFLGGNRHCTLVFEQGPNIDPRVKCFISLIPYRVMPQTTGPDECFHDQFGIVIHVTSFGDVMRHAPFVTQKPPLQATFRVSWNHQPLVLVVDVSSLWLFVRKIWSEFDTRLGKVTFGLWPTSFVTRVFFLPSLSFGKVLVSVGLFVGSLVYIFVCLQQLIFAPFQPSHLVDISHIVLVWIDNYDSTHFRPCIKVKVKVQAR